MLCASVQMRTFAGQNLAAHSLKKEAEIEFCSPIWHSPFHLFKVAVATGWKATGEQQWRSLCFICNVNNKEKTVEENVKKGEITAQLET